MANSHTAPPLFCLLSCYKWDCSIFYLIFWIALYLQAKHAFEQLREEIRNRNSEDINMLRISLDAQIEGNLGVFIFNSSSSRLIWVSLKPHSQSFYSKTYRTFTLLHRHIPHLIQYDSDRSLKLSPFLLWYDASCPATFPYFADVASTTQNWRPYSRQLIWTTSSRLHSAHTTLKNWRRMTRS